MYTLFRYHTTKPEATMDEAVPPPPENPGDMDPKAMVPTCPGSFPGVQIRQWTPPPNTERFTTPPGNPGDMDPPAVSPTLLPKGQGTSPPSTERSPPTSPRQQQQRGVPHLDTERPPPISPERQRTPPPKVELSLPHSPRQQEIARLNMDRPPSPLPSKLPRTPTERSPPPSPRQQQQGTPRLDTESLPPVPPKRQLSPCPKTERHSPQQQGAPRANIERSPPSFQQQRQHLKPQATMNKAVLHPPRNPRNIPPPDMSRDLDLETQTAQSTLCPNIDSPAPPFTSTPPPLQQRQQQHQQCTKLQGTTNNVILPPPGNLRNEAPAAVPPQPDPEAQSRRGTPRPNNDGPFYSLPRSLVHPQKHIKSQRTMNDIDSPLENLRNMASPVSSPENPRNVALLDLPLDPDLEVKIQQRTPRPNADNPPLPLPLPPQKQQQQQPHPIPQLQPQPQPRLEQPYPQECRAVPGHAQAPLFPEERAPPVFANDPRPPMYTNDLRPPIYTNDPYHTIHVQVLPAQQESPVQDGYSVCTPAPPEFPPPQVLRQVSRTPAPEPVSPSEVSKSESSSGHTNPNRRIPSGRKPPKNKSRQKRKESGKRGKSTSLIDGVLRAVNKGIARQPEVRMGVAWEASTRRTHSNHSDENYRPRNKN